MKNNFLIILILFTNFVFSQEKGDITEPWSKSLGIMIAPQGGIDLTRIDDGFSNQSNVFVVANFAKGKNTFTPFYSVTNSLGMAYSRSFLENYGMYVVANKKVLADGGYLGIGATRSVGNASVFVEVGSLWNTWSPGFYLGAFIPLTFKI
ncbi:hypothetical protein KC901_01300 [Patescibacteria group bacterium]|nr:hypothetical protein [Patescibacteria group bacterium]